jgi:hypothetical protein
VLDDREYAALSDSSKAYLVGLLCLYARTHEAIPVDLDYLRRKLAIKGKLDLPALAKWIEKCAPGEQGASPAPAQKREEKKEETKREESACEPEQSAAAPPLAPGETVPARREPTYTPGPTRPNDDPEFIALWKVAMHEVWTGDAVAFLGNKRESWTVYRRMLPPDQAEADALRITITDYLRTLTKAPRFGLEKLLESRAWEKKPGKESTNGHDASLSLSPADLAALGLSAPSA